MVKYESPPLQEITFDEERFMDKLAAVFRNLLPKGSKYIAVAYVAGGSTGVRAGLSTNIEDQEMVVRGLREMADTVETHGISFGPVGHKDN